MLVSVPIDSQHDIAGLDIAMDYIKPMRVFYRCRRSISQVVTVDGRPYMHRIWCRNKKEDRLKIAAGPLFDFFSVTLLVLSAQHD